MNGELEYLVRVYTDAVRVGTVKGFAKRHRPGCKEIAGGNTVSGS